MHKSTPTIGFDAIRRWPSPEAMEWVRAFLEAAWHDARVKAVVAIGSAVRPVKSSVDVDLVVVYGDGAAPSFPSAPIDVDLRYFPADQLRHLALDGHDLIGWAVKFGLPIIDKDGRWSHLVDEIRDEIPLPSPEAALRRAERAMKLLEQLVAAGDDDAAHEQLLAYLTHLARATLARNRVYPASRPELPEQLRRIGEHQLAGGLEYAIAGDTNAVDTLATFTDGGGSGASS